MKVHLATNSNCVGRQLDVARLQEYFRVNGWTPVDAASSADLIVAVTCAFTPEAAEAGLEMVRRFRGVKAKLIVAGCLPEIDPAGLAAIFSGSTVPTHSLEKIDDLFPEFETGFQKIPPANRTNASSLFPSSRPGLYWKKFCRYPDLALRMFVRKRRIDGEREEEYHIRVSEGCDQNCSYCVLAPAIGKLRSKSIEACRRELCRGLQAGFTGFVLDGDDLGAYGLDSGSDFPELLQALLAVPGVRQLELRALNPVWLVRYRDDLVGWAQAGRLSGLCCCLQSGSGRILSLMKRYPDVGEILSALGKIKESSPEIFLSAYVIVGFPSETVAEFEETIAAVEKAGFNRVIVFPYQDDEKSAASALEEKIPPAVIAKRTRRLYRALKRNGVEAICV